jgi:tetratricopeptide (TPR) repeat protein
MLTDLLQRLPVRRQVLAGALAAVLLVAGVLTYQRNLVWTSDVALWQDAVQKAPQNGRAHFQLASAYHLEAGRCDLAALEYAAAYRIYGPRYDLLIDWAEALDCANQPDDALSKLRQAAALEPQAHAYMEIGKVAANHQRYGEALEAFATAEKLDPNYVMTYVNRGTLYKMLKQYGLAVENYRRALAIDPANQLAFAGLAEVQRLAGRSR